MPVLENYVVLETGKTKRIRFKPPRRIEDMQIEDPRTKVQKTVKAWVCDVSEEDGTVVTKTFAVVSERAARQLEALHNTGELYQRTIAILRTGAGFATQYTVTIL